MKNHLLLLLFLLSMAVVSCNNDSDPIPQPLPVEATGNLDITLKFTHDQMLGAYMISTARPITTWSNNILDLLMILSDSNKVIKYATPVALSTSTTNGAETRSFTGVPVGTYTVTIVANSGQSNIGTPGYTSGWTPANIVGQNLNTLILTAKVDSTFVPITGETGYTAYQSPAEIFTASQTNVIISADVTTTVATPFTLTRIISIARIRLDRSKNGNTVIQFNDPITSVRIQNIGTFYNLATGADTIVTSSEMCFRKGATLFNTAEPTSGYTTGTLLDIPNKITFWSDIIIFSGGSATVTAKKFKVIVCGMAPAGYRTANSTILFVATPVYWSGIVSAAVLPNNIMEVNCTLSNKGSLTIP